MTGGRRLLALLTAGLLGLGRSGAGGARRDPRSSPPSRPRRRRARPASVARPTAPPASARASYIADVCRLIETAARRERLDPSFFARLIWKESLFDASAVSPAGAQGIAQFMPGTAELRGLEDPFNPAEALTASARYLADLASDFGNIGLAAVAYNGGEARAALFVAAKGALPAETRAYVQAITGHSADAWRDAPPDKLDLALPGEAGFQAACIAQAETRKLREFPAGPPVRPGASSSPRTASATAPSARSAGCRTATPPSSPASRSATPAAAARAWPPASTWPRSAARAAPRPTPSAPVSAARAPTAWCSGTRGSGLGQQRLQVQPLGHHPQVAVGIARPFRLAAGPSRARRRCRRDRAGRAPRRRRGRRRRRARRRRRSAGAARRRGRGGSGRGWRCGRARCGPAAAGVPPRLSQVLRPMWWW